MLPRKGTLIVLGIIVLFFAGVYSAWNILKIDEKLKVLLMNRISPELEQEISLKKLSPGINYLVAEGLTISSPDSTYELHLDKVKLGFSLGNFIKNGFKLVKSLEEIIIEKPTIILRSGKKKQIDEETLRQNIEVLLTTYENKYWKFLEEFHFIKRILFAGGTVILKIPHEDDLVLLSDANGWLDVTNIRNIEMWTNCRLLSSEKDNFIIKSTINLEKRSFTSYLHVLESTVNKERSVNYLKAFEILKGSVNGFIYLSYNENNENKLTAKGEIALQDGSFNLTTSGIQFDNIYLKGTLTEKEISIIEFKHNYYNADITVNGVIKNLFNPQFDIHINFSNLELQDINRGLQFSGSNTYRGKVSGDFHLKGTLSKPLIDGTITSKKLGIQNTPIRNIKTIIKLEKNIFSLPLVSFNLSNNKLTGTGTFKYISKDSATAYFKLGGTMKPVKGIIPESIVYDLTLNITLTGNLSNPKIKGKSRINFTYDNDSSNAHYVVSSDVKYTKGYWELSGFTGDSLSTLRGTIKEQDSKNVLEIKLSNVLPFLYFLNGTKTIHNINKKHVLETKLDYKNGITTLNGTGFSRADSSVGFTINSSYKSVKGLGEFFETTVNYATGTPSSQKGELKILKKGTQLFIEKLDIPGIAFGNGTIILGNETEVEGKLHIASDFRRMGALLNFNEIQSGTLLGEIEVSGVLKSPEIKGNISFSNCTVRNIPDFSGNIKMNSHDCRVFKFDEIYVSNNNSTLLKASGFYTAGNDFDFNIKGEQVNLGTLWKIIQPGSDFLSGDLTYNLNYLRKNEKTSLSGFLKAERGTINFFNYDNFSLNLHKTVTTNDTLPREKTFTSQYSFLLPDELLISELRLNQNNTINITANGILPINLNREIDADISVFGDMLSILPQIDPFFQQTNSMGSLLLSFTGTLNNPSVEKGFLKITNGEIKTATAFNKLTQINLELNLDSPEGFVRLTDCSAFMDGRKITITNTNSVKINDINKGEFSLPPLAIQDAGLNFGILIVNTDPKGIQFSIEDIFEKGDKGTFSFGGRQKNEQFYIAGPVQNPYIRGTIKIRETKLTYPPPERKKKQTESLVNKILLSAYWDLKVIPEKDNRYFREEPVSSLPVTGKVYINTRIDNSREGLDFQGIITEGNFWVTGELESTRGMIEFLGTRFFAERIVLEFRDITEFKTVSSVESSTPQIPILSGMAKTTIRDSTGIGMQVIRDVYLIIYSENQEENEILEYGSLDDLKFALSLEPSLNRFRVERKTNVINDSRHNLSEIPQTQQEILAILGYSPSQIPGKIEEIVGNNAASTILKPIIRPIEQTISRKLGFDEFRIQPRIGQNILGGFLHSRFENNGNKINVFDPKYLFLSSQFILGKYLTRNLYFSYIGQLSSSSHIYDNTEPNLGLNYILGFEYRISPRLFLEFQYDYLYYRYEDKGDRKMWLRHFIPLK